MENKEIDVIKIKEEILSKLDGLDGYIANHILDAAKRELNSDYLIVSVPKRPIKEE